MVQCLSRMPTGHKQTLWFGKNKFSKIWWAGVKTKYSKLFIKEYHKFDTPHSQTAWHHIF